MMAAMTEDVDEIKNLIHPGDTIRYLGPDENGQVVYADLRVSSVMEDVHQGFPGFFGYIVDAEGNVTDIDRWGFLSMVVEVNGVPFVMDGDEQ